MKRTLCILFACFLGGCAAAAESALMVPSTPLSGEEVNTALLRSIGIGAVTGGEETDPMQFSRVSNEDLREALRISLNNVGFLASEKKSEKFVLNASLLELTFPRSGFTQTTSAFIRYELQRIDDGEVIYDETITTEFTATIDDEFVGIARVKLTNEGAVRENIAEFLRALTNLTTQPAQSSRFGRT